MEQNGVLSYSIKNAAYAVGMRTSRKRNMVAGATALRIKHSQFSEEKEEKRCLVIAWKM